MNISQARRYANNTDVGFVAYISIAERELMTVDVAHDQIHNILDQLPADHELPWKAGTCEYEDEIGYGIMIVVTTNFFSSSTGGIK